ncbi:hypothetical protein M427DRAFT_51847 [Gonapodya prolifera JEL478]|uniref:Uncharacterized protein n=1 Tax=Gonapodya prolifera (strain JEL478) TaxID=1344416 RepID=A0A139AVX2_GONPJ|nr:hypothetical protein M427DRAFT_51847 [Gonapodya prolifera JEL478]|eukprot:KXS20891.1 hypothetical protein M427DRAFT_51847 [Gonapodya prolifera JEL478]
MSSAGRTVSHALSPRPDGQNRRGGAPTNAWAGGAPRDPARGSTPPVRDRPLSGSSPGASSGSRSTGIASPSSPNPAWSSQSAWGGTRERRDDSGERSDKPHGREHSQATGAGSGGSHPPWPGRGQHWGEKSGSGAQLVRRTSSGATSTGVPGQFDSKAAHAFLSGAFGEVWERAHSLEVREDDKPSVFQPFASASSQSSVVVVKGPVNWDKSDQFITASGISVADALRKVAKAYEVEGKSNESSRKEVNGN